MTILFTKMIFSLLSAHCVSKAQVLIEKLKQKKRASLSTGGCIVLNFNLKKYITDY
jgi:hypothetical protein